VALELLDGVPLTERLADGRLDWPEAVRIAATAADVLAVAHRRGVVHRDLSARNVMIAADGVKIIDFGLATATRPGDGTTAPSPGAAVLPHFRTVAPHRDPGAPGPDRGAPGWDRGAPGRDRGSPGPGRGAPGWGRGGPGWDRGAPPSHPKTAFARPADDVYTLGVLLYEMLTGRSPYPPAVAAMIVAAGRAAHLAPTPVLAIPGLPPRLRDLVRACMAKRPEDRPASVDVALDLWRLLDEARPLEPSVN
jgi:serine/threonine protein kinase